MKENFKGAPLALSLQSYSYDDIFLIPQYSDIRSRSDVDTSTKIFDLQLKIPVLAANMDTICDSAMAIAMWNIGGIGAIHRFMSIENNVIEFQKVKEAKCECVVSIGVNDMERIDALVNAGAKYFCLDVAHGHHILVKEALRAIRKKYDYHVNVIAGNVASYEGVRDLKTWGADIVKVNIGPGSCCSTRINTGVGVPTFSCIQECRKAADDFAVKIIADGGCKTPGDLVKAFAAGCHYVMLGSMLAGCDESPGAIVDAYGANGGPFKVFRGMASKEAQDAYFRTSKAPEGVSTKVPLKGSVAKVLADIMGNFRSGMSYINAHTLDEINFKAKWGIQTSAGYHEGTPHGAKYGK